MHPGRRLMPLPFPFIEKEDSVIAIWQQEWRIMQNFIDKTYYAAIYLRLSKEDGDSSTGEKKESNSIANQRKLIEDYLTRHPEINMVQEFCDDGFTGANFDRPDFQKMIEQVKQRKINCIIPMTMKFWN